ncbi:T9SS type A sorting domain-containing protein [Chitinispirillales bacterium ANBcel5]|uniref:T9SS type A sorting domain-containing protein n=1 Tax=Cellulosispirillum alkaliphilum TaxID=3039283 RepID=UPI002A4E9236|nr:T9SS type A sorting domain-containing protein [Chitinispirillales bacterium ANBcel5]
MPHKTRFTPKKISMAFSLLLLLLSSLSAEYTWNWESVYSDTTALFTTVIYENDMFVAVGGSGLILTSSDGKEWVSQESNTTRSLNSVIWADSMFMAVGNGGTILTSHDGVEWSVRPTYITGSDGRHIDYRSVAYGSGKFLVVGGGHVNYSHDGIEWEPIHRRPGMEMPNDNVIYADGKFVSASWTNILFSEDGLEWESEMVYDPYANPWFWGEIEWGNGKFMAVNTDREALAVSSDLKDWEIKYPIRWIPNNIYFDGEQFLLFDYEIYTTKDGTDLDRVVGSSRFSLESIAYNGEYYVVCTSRGEIAILRKPTSSANNFTNSTLNSHFTVRQLSGVLNVTVPVNKTIAESSVNLYNAQGRRVSLENKINRTNDGFTVHTSHLPPGFYILHAGKGFSTPVFIAR